MRVNTSHRNRDLVPMRVRMWAISFRGQLDEVDQTLRPLPRSSGGESQADPRMSPSAEEETVRKIEFAVGPHPRALSATKMMSTNVKIDWLYVELEQWQTPCGRVASICTEK